MCNCSSNRSVPRPSGRSATPRTYYAVYDGDEKVSGKFGDMVGAERKRDRLCSEVEDCTLTVELVPA